MVRPLVFKALLISTSLLPFAVSAQTTAKPDVPAEGLGDIIVTATKRSENLQNVPVSITAITSDQLTKQGVFSTADLNNSIPNLQVSSAYGETQPNFTIRGIGVGTEYNSNAASPVGVYVDEVYQSFRASQGQQLYDLRQVEIVRGPQGTLFGRNTTGGAINFITEKPKLGDTTGYATIGYGSYNRVSAEGAIEVTPIADKLGIRIAGNYVNADPYVRNVLPAGTLVKASPNIPDSVAYGDRATGISPGGAETFGLRGTVRYKPTPDIDLSFKAYVSQAIGGQDSTQSHGPSLTSDTISLADSAFGFFYTPAAAAAYGVPNLASLLPPPYSPSGLGLNSRQIDANSIGYARIKTAGTAFTAKIALSDKLNLTSITGYDKTHYELLPQIDCDGTPYNVCAIGYESKSRSFNQDLRVDYGSGPLKAIVGAYYGWDKIVTNNAPDFYGFLSDVNAALGNPKTYFNPIGIGAIKPGPSVVPFVTALKATQDYTQVRKSFATYGEGSYEITSTLKLTAGLRYTWDTFGYNNALTTFYDDAGNPRLYTISDYAPGGVFTNYEIGVSPGTAHPLNRSDKSSALTGRAIVDWKPIDHVLAYASYSRGYRGGTYNGLAFQKAAQVYFVKPETVDAFEVGLKSRFLDNRAQFNISIYHYIYKNQQSQLLDPSAVTFLTNLNGKLDGLDAEFNLAVTDRIRFNAGLGILDSKFDKGNCGSAPIPAVPPQQGNCVATARGIVDVGGNPFPYAAKVSANLGVDWRAADFSDGSLTLHADTSYTGRYYYDFFGNYSFVGTNYTGQQFTDRDAARGPLHVGGGDYWLVNSRLSFATKSYSVALWVKNLTDKLYYPNGINVEGSYGSDYLIRAAPRTFGAEVSVRF